ncbi:hypothetical protein CDG79_11390 [Nostoc sp. 'Peltigera membranacea cyanobiont' 232]|nr:hypothetical protein CDG79_11390 [Nostoc sp. 'Peltigera membranacea cyanobiont' 232]
MQMLIRAFFVGRMEYLKWLLIGKARHRQQVSKVTQFKQEIEQLREIQQGIVSALSSDTSMDLEQKAKVFACSYVAVKTLKKILEDLDKRNGS